MKKLFSFLSLCLLVFVVPAKAQTEVPAETTATATKVETNLQQAADQAASQKAEAEASAQATHDFTVKTMRLRAEQRVVPLTNDVATLEAIQKKGFVFAQEIVWEEFEEQTDTIRDNHEDAQEDLNKEEQDFGKLISPVKLATILQTPYKDRPDYAQLTKGKKYIYIAESSGHNTRTLPQEGGRILTQLRAKYPKARILVALEMAMLKNQFETPLLPATSQDHPAIDIYKEYLVLSDTAQKQGMDVLALDDTAIFETQFPETYVAKVGSYAVRFRSTSPRIQRLIAPYKSVYEANGLAPLLAVYDVLSRSSWGVQKRNDQWARYIKSVADLYDIIVIYAGNAHLMLNVAYSVPNLIGEDGILLELLTTEKLPEELQKFANSAAEVQNKHKLSPEFQPTELTSYEDRLLEARMTQLKPFLKRLNKGEAFWVEHATNKKLRVEILPQLPRKEYQKYKEKLTGLLPEDFAWAAVYLPEEK